MSSIIFFLFTGFWSVYSPPSKAKLCFLWSILSLMRLFYSCNFIRLTWASFWNLTCLCSVSCIVGGNVNCFDFVEVELSILRYSRSRAIFFCSLIRGKKSWFIYSSLSVGFTGASNLTLSSHFMTPFDKLRLVIGSGRLRSSLSTYSYFQRSPSNGFGLNSYSG